MKNLIVLILLISVPASLSAGWQIVFSDDFNRPDGPLGPPWFDAGPGVLRIQSGRVVCDSLAYGLSGYDHSEAGPSIALETDFSFLGDANGWFHFWIAGIGGPGDTVAYGAEMDRHTFGLYFYPPESLLVEKAFAFDPYTVYTMRLEYDHLTGIASLIVRDAFGPTADSIWTYGVGTDFNTIRVGIEDKDSIDKWFDNVVLWQKPWSGMPDEARDGGPRLKIHRPYPNPCSEQTVIAYETPRSMHVSITIYNTVGQEVRRWQHRAATPGYHEHLWDATSNDGSRVAPGVYLCTVQAEAQAVSRKIVITP
jgi:hypothetical protein